MSKAKVELGFRTFLESAYELDDTLPEDVQFLAATDEITVDPEKYSILVNVGEIAPSAGIYYLAQVEVAVIAPIKGGYKAGRDQLSRFVEAVFPRALPPAPGANSAHLSSHVAEATDDAYTVRGYYPGTVRTLPTEGGQDWHVITPLTVGLCRNDPAPPVPSGEITLDY
jgi:hypothetical protein